MSEDLQEEEWLYGGDSNSVPKTEPVLANPEDVDGDSHGIAEEAEDRDGETSGGEGDAQKNSIADGPSLRKEGAAGVEEEREGEEAEEEDDEDEDEDSDDDDDDGVQVVIGDIKSSTVTAQAPFSSKRVPGPPPDKKGKFSTDDFEGVGTINGVPAQDFSLDSIEEKPWRKPGADLTDYFNYGFTEETWRAYCDRQKRLRYESGNTMPIVERERKHHPQGGSHSTTSIPTIGSDNKYGGPPNVIFPKKFGMQDRVNKDIQRISRVRDEHRENTIQVMTADRREYSRKAFDMPPPPIVPPPFDMSVPPPSFPPPDPYGGPPDFFNHPPPARYYPEEPIDYEEQQWMDSAWEANMKGPGPSGVTTVVPLTKVPHLPPPPGEGDDLDPPSKDDKS